MAMIEMAASKTASLSFLVSVFKVTFPLLPWYAPVYEKSSEQLPVIKSTDDTRLLTNSMNKPNLSPPFLPDKVWKNLRHVFQSLKAPEQTYGTIIFFTIRYDSCASQDARMKADSCSMTIFLA
jgi:hypothetical protein